MDSLRARNGWKRAALLLGLGLALVIQAWITNTHQVQPWLQRIDSVEPRDPFLRSAELAFGADFADYIEFLRTSVPPDQQVVIPAQQIDSTLGNAALMQYFLYPRPVASCASEESFAACVQHRAAAADYFLSVPSFHPQNLAGLEGQLMELDGSWGLYVEER